MANKLSADSFLAVVKQSGLVEQEQLKKFWHGFKEQGHALDDSQVIADRLVGENLVTKWQVDKLLQGKHKGFFLGKYRLLSHLGSGGMSSVYLAEHVLMRRRVAIKVLPQARIEDSSYLERFHREAQAVAALDHPNIVRAYDVDQESKVHFLVMEYVTGSSLQEMIQRDGPMAPIFAADYIRQAADGIASAHQAGMVHRDIKPGNLLVDAKGIVKLLDLGLAMFFEGGEDNSLTRRHDEKVLGTADYLAPEQAIDSHSVDFRADIYSLGCTFYFLLTGNPPFPDGTLAQRLLAHQTREPKPVEELRPDAPPGLVAIVKKMMAKSANDRYQTGKEASEALSRWLVEHAGPEWRKKHPHLAAANSAANLKPANTPPTAMVARPATARVVSQMTAPVAAPPPAAAPVAAAPAAQEENAFASFFAQLDSQPAEPARTRTPGSSVTRRKPGSSVTGSGRLSSPPPAPAPPQFATDPPPGTAHADTEATMLLDPLENPPPTAPPAAPGREVVAPSPAPAAASHSHDTIADFTPPQSLPQPDATTFDFAPPDQGDFDFPSFDAPAPTPPARPVVAAPVAAAPPVAAPPVAAAPVVTAPVAAPVARAAVVATPVAAAPVPTAAPVAQAVAAAPAPAAAIPVMAAPVARPAAGRPGTGKSRGGKAPPIDFAALLKNKRAVMIAGGVAGGLVLLLGIAGFAGVFGGSKPAPAPSRTGPPRPVAATTPEEEEYDSGPVRPRAPSGNLSRRKIEVGPTKAFTTIAAGLADAKSHAGEMRNVPSAAQIITVDGGSYAERIVLDKDFPKGVHLIAREGEKIVLNPTDSGPVVQIQDVERFRMDGVRIEAAGKPVAIQIGGWLAKLDLKNIEVAGFTQTGLVGLGPNSYSSDKIILTNVTLQAGSPEATGMAFRGGTAQPSHLNFLNCRLLGPMQTGIVFEAPAMFVNVQGCIISEAATGVKFSAGSAVWRDITFTNNTFYKSQNGIVFTEMPGAGSNGFGFYHNLFAQQQGLEVVVQKDLKPVELNAMLATSGSGSLRNMSDRAATMPADPTDYNIFASGARGGVVFQFISTDPSAATFLAPAPSSPQGTAPGSALAAGYIGAVAPPPP